MRMRLATVMAVLSIGAAAGQTVAVKGELKCEKPLQIQTTDVGDSAGHTLALAKYTCDWSKAMDILNVHTSKDTLTIASEIRGDDSQNHGYETLKMANGDRLFVRYIGASSLNKKTGQGAWRISGGEGKFRGITGSGDFHSTQTPEGALTIAFNGTYLTPPTQ